MSGPDKSSFQPDYIPPTFWGKRPEGKTPAAAPNPYSGIIPPEIMALIKSAVNADEEAALTALIFDILSGKIAIDFRQGLVPMVNLDGTLVNFDVKLPYLMAIHYFFQHTKGKGLQIEGGKAYVHKDALKGLLDTFINNYVGVVGKLKADKLSAKDISFLIKLAFTFFNENITAAQLKDHGFAKTLIEKAKKALAGEDKLETAVKLLAIKIDPKELPSIRSCFNLIAEGKLKYGFKKQE